MFAEEMEETRVLVMDEDDGGDERSLQRKIATAKRATSVKCELFCSERGREIFLGFSFFI